jgi:hypothetical protein
VFFKERLHFVWYMGWVFVSSVLVSSVLSEHVVAWILRCQKKKKKERSVPKSVAQYGDCDFVSIVSPEHLCERFLAVRSYIFMLIKLGNRVMNLVSPCVALVVMIRWEIDVCRY